MAQSCVTSENLDIVDSIDSIDFDADSNTFWATYDSAHDAVSLAVVAVIAAVEDRAPTDLRPLASAVNTDALQGLFETPSEQLPTPTTTTFRYEGYEVTVTSEEVVEATPLEDA